MMRGLLWFDADKKTTLPAKVETVMKYYFKKFGHIPDVCLVSEKIIQGVDLAETSRLTSITVKASKTVQPNHFWIGYEEALPVAGSEQ